MCNSLAIPIESIGELWYNGRILDAWGDDFLKLQSSFIFLNNTNEKSGAKSKKEIVLPKSIILYIKELFGAC